MKNYKLNNKNVEIYEGDKLVKSYTYDEIIENAVQYYEAAGFKISMKDILNKDIEELVEDTLLHD